MSSTTDTTEAPRDERREAEIARVLGALGSSIVDSLVKPNDDMWIRVTADSWQSTGETLKSLGYTYFCFLSAIDWSSSSGRCSINPHRLFYQKRRIDH